MQLSTVYQWRHCSIVLFVQRNLCPRFHPPVLSNPPISLKHCQNTPKCCYCGVEPYASMLPPLLRWRLYAAVLLHTRTSTTTAGPLRPCCCCALRCAPLCVAAVCRRCVSPRVAAVCSHVLLLCDFASRIDRHRVLSPIFSVPHHWHPCFYIPPVPSKTVGLKGSETNPYLRERILGGACFNEGGGVCDVSHNSIQYHFSVHNELSLANSTTIPYDHWF